MEFPSRLTGGFDPAIAPHASMLPIREDSKIPPSIQRDLGVARTTRANLLLVGTERQVTRLLRVAVADSSHAAVVRCQNGRLLLPSMPSGAETIVIRDVDALTSEDQWKLCEWLDSRSDRTQVISTASAPLVPLVDSQLFNDALYYRLNVVYLDLSE
jgi:DNA-binding NtrC family response regulator